MMCAHDMFVWGYMFCYINIGMMWRRINDGIVLQFRRRIECHVYLICDCLDTGLQCIYDGGKRLYVIWGLICRMS